MSEQPTVGRVSSVFTEGGKVYINVQNDRPGMEDDKIPFRNQNPGMMVTPQEGDLVELYKVRGGGTAARFTQNPASFDMPNLGENEMVFRFGPDTELRFSKDASGNYTARIAGDVAVEIESNTDVNVLAGDTISLGSGGDTLVTDVSTTTDADGHVTGISLTKTTKTNAE